MRSEVALQALQDPAQVFPELRRSDAREADPHVAAVDVQAARPAEEHVRRMELGQIDDLDNLERRCVGDDDVAVDRREVDMAVMDLAVVDALEADVDAA